MSQGHCTSNTHLWRSRCLSGLVGATLFSTPVFAGEVADVHLVAAPTEVANKSAAFAEAVPEPAATPVARCSAVMLASSAMIAPAAPPSTAKSSAILGGEISSLDRIRLAQSGTAAPAVAPVPLMTAVAADLSNEDMRRPELIDQVARFDACNDRPQISSVMPAITDDRLILGSLRLSIRKTPFDQKWRSVSQAGHARGLKRSLLRTGAIAADGPHARVAAINSWVNSKIAYADDLALYRQNDFWASSRETLRRGKGDCEDYAILKMDLLAAMGIDRDKMIWLWRAIWSAMPTMRCLWCSWMMGPLCWTIRPTFSSMAAWPMTTARSCLSPAMANGCMAMLWPRPLCNPRRQRLSQLQRLPHSALR